MKPYLNLKIIINNSANNSFDEKETGEKHITTPKKNIDTILINVSYIQKVQEMQKLGI